MKRKAVLALSLISVLILSACGESAPIITGNIVNCKTIQTLENAKAEYPTLCLDSSDGVNVAAIKGPAIINVWGSWCKPCTDELPIFSEFYQSLDPAIILIGVDVEEKSLESGRMFARTHGIMWPNLYDKEGTTRKYFGMGVPVTWFIGEDGSVISKHTGAFESVEELRTATFKAFGVS
jgi:thiol-disulfide isomerase/thioredoxin